MLSFGKLTRLHFLFALLIVFFISARPKPPKDTYFHGGSVEDAVVILAEASVTESSSIHERAITDEYEHWSLAKNYVGNGLNGENTFGSEGSSFIDGNDSQNKKLQLKAIDIVGVKSANEDSPLIAGIVGIAAVTGLRELASICLYLKIGRAHV